MSHDNTNANRAGAALHADACEMALHASACELTLHALACTLAEPARAERFISATGLDPDDLRRRVGEPAVLAAVLGFLEAHEPDLIAAAAALDRPPAALVAARAALETQ